MEVSYPRAKTISWFRDFTGFSSTQPNLFGTKCFVVVVSLALVLAIYHVHVFSGKAKLNAKFFLKLYIVQIGVLAPWHISFPVV